MKKFIAELQKAYYDGEPLITNEEYDALVKRFPDAEVTIGNSGEVKHMFRMWSLDKKYPCRGDELPDLTPYIRTPKLDGCAIEYLYLEGKLVQALTRGDGVKGKDVTANARHLVPSEIEYFAPIMQIVGEVTVTKEVENRRNFASGAMGIKEELEFLDRAAKGGLSFVAYSVQTDSEQPGLGSMYDNDMSELSNLGFSTVLDTKIQSMVDEGSIPTDGEVYRLRRNRAFQAAGFTSKFPKGAFALKEDDAGVVTEIEDVIWQVGASGKVTPVAIVKEIELEDARVTRVTLNNTAYMESMGINEIGQKVRVIRAGGIIPKIIEAL